MLSWLVSLKIRIFSKTAISTDVFPHDDRKYQPTPISGQKVFTSQTLYYIFLQGTTTVAYLFILTLIFIIVTLHSKSDNYYHVILIRSEQRHKYSTSEILSEKMIFKLFCVGSGANQDSITQHPLRTQEQMGTLSLLLAIKTAGRQDLWFSFLFQFYEKLVLKPWALITTVFIDHTTTFLKPFMNTAKIINNAKFIYPNIFYTCMGGGFLDVRMSLHNVCAWGGGSQKRRWDRLELTL